MIDILSMLGNVNNVPYKKYENKTMQQNMRKSSAGKYNIQMLHDNIIVYKQ